MFEVCKKCGGQVMRHSDGEIRCFQCSEEPPWIKEQYKRELRTLINNSRQSELSKLVKGG